MNAIEDNEFSRAWRALGARLLPRPRAVLCVSAHWVTAGTRIHMSASPRTIHDFYGFPEALHRVRYPAGGAPEIARESARVLGGIQEDQEWGLDHGAWSVLMHLFPQADVPVFQMSLNSSFTMAEHYRLGQELRVLRRQGVLILGSGNIVHNLREVRWAPQAEPYDYAIEFRDQIRSLIQAGELEKMMEFITANPGLFQQAHPTDEHFLPLLYVLGARDTSDQLSLLTDRIDLGSIAMTGFLFDSKSG